MSALTPDLRGFLDREIVGVLATTGADGRPRQSLVYFARDGDRLLVTTEAGRVKARDVLRTGWASLCVPGHEPPFPSATFAGPATILTADIGSATASIAQRVMGADEPPEPLTDEALAAAGRVILALNVERVGPVTYVSAS